MEFIAGAVRSAAEVAFPLPAQRPRRPWLSREASDILDARRELRRRRVGRRRAAMRPSAPRVFWRPPRSECGLWKVGVPVGKHAPERVLGNSRASCESLLFMSLTTLGSVPCCGTETVRPVVVLLGPCSMLGPNCCWKCNKRNRSKSKRNCRCSVSGLSLIRLLRPGLTVAAVVTQPWKVAAHPSLSSSMGAVGVARD